ncbi:uncharacterized protein LOC127006480 [Eriocheir sinensis]|uniref:uncharacterized protein LOC127006480 n=1 Tax=Eriocheir sinensis TaxID=95602 RepID=UPI0021C946E1|nr:uncharacterized protein LOC127006480 [Eriocheir sinensis]
MGRGDGKGGGATCCVMTFVGFFVLVTVGLAVTWISIGFVYLHACPLEPFIPVFLIVHGFTWLIGFAMELMIYYKYICSDQRSLRLTVIRAHLYLFHFAWEIAGSVCVFRAASEQRQATEGTETCDPVVYNTALVHVIFMYVVLGLSILIKMCCCFCCDSDSDIHDVFQ